MFVCRSLKYVQLHRLEPSHPASLLAQAMVQQFVYDAEGSAESTYEAVIACDHDQRPEYTLAAVYGLYALGKERKDREDAFIRTLDMSNVQGDDSMYMLYKAHQNRDDTGVVTMCLPKYLRAKGEALFRQSRMDESFRLLSTAIKQDPSDGEGFLTLGRLYFAKGDEIRGIKCYEKSFQLNSLQSLEVVKQLSGFYYVHGDGAKALAAYRSVIQEAKNRIARGENVSLPRIVAIHAFSWLKLGQEQYGAAKYSLAKTSFQKALSLTLETASSTREISISAAIGLGDAYLRLGQYLPSKKTFEKALTLMDIDLPQSRAYCLYRLGHISLALSEVPDGLRHLQNLKILEDSCYDGSNSFGCLWGVAVASVKYLESLIKDGMYKRALNFAEDEAVPSMTELCRIYFQDRAMKEAVTHVMKLCGDFYILLSTRIPYETDTLIVRYAHEAKIQYSRAIFENPWDAGGWYDLGVLEQCTVPNPQDQDGAFNLPLRLAKSAVVLHPTNSHIWNFLGIAFAPTPDATLAMQVILS